MSSNIPSAQAYGVYASQLICYARCCLNYSNFLSSYRAYVTRLLLQRYKVNRLSKTFKKFLSPTHWSSWTIQEKYLPNVCWFYQLKWFWFFMDLQLVELIKLAKMASVMHEAHHAYSFRSTWWLHWLATDAPSIACVINSHLGFVELSFSLWIVIFFILIYLSPVGLFCECCSEYRFEKFLVYVLPKFNWSLRCASCYPYYFIGNLTQDVYNCIDIC